MAYPTGVNFIHATAPIGSQPIHETSTTQQHPLGLVVTAKDHTYGEGKFIYLKGVASTAQGDLVCYDSKTGDTVRAVNGGTGSNGPAAIAMSANVASQYGWYQIYGSGPVKSGTVLANGAAYMTATAGQVDDAAVSGDQVDGLTFRSTDSGGYATVQIDYPNVSGLGGASGTNTGDVTLAAVGAVANANGASLSGQVLNLQPASGTFPGLLLAADFTKLAAQSGTNTGDVTLGAVGATPSDNGASLSGQVLTLQPADATHPGVMVAADYTKLAAQSGTNTGDVTLGAVGASPNDNGASLSGQVLTLQPASATKPGVMVAADFVKVSNLSGTNSGDVTIGNLGSGTDAKGATISGQAISMQSASNSGPGVVDTTSQTFAGDKTFAGSVILTDAKPNSVANATGTSVGMNGETRTGWLEVTVAKEAFIDAALTQDITLCVIPAKMRILAAYADTTAAFGGTAGTLAITCGVTAGGAEIIASHDVKSAPVTKGLADADMGTAMARAAAIQGGYVPSWSATSTVQMRLTSGTGDLGTGAATNLTTGSVTFYFKLELP